MKYNKNILDTEFGFGLCIICPLRSLCQVLKNKNKNLLIFYKNWVNIFLSNGFLS